jgi:hypothetical protein
MAGPVIAMASSPDRVRQERREDQECPVRDVDDVHHAEDQRQARRHQRVHAADQQAEDDRLDELRHDGVSAPGAGRRARRRPASL